MKTLSRIISLILIVSFTLFTSCGDSSTGSGYGDGNGEPGPNEVFMENISFNPQQKTTSPGTEITWVNKDATAHTVRSGTPGKPTDLFNSGNISENQSFSFTFNNVGSYDYFCEIHGADMTGVINVEE